MISDILFPIIDRLVLSLKVHGHPLSSIKDILILAVKEIPVSRKN
jgi:hypothetical protein